MALMLRNVRIARYRSLRSIHFPIGRLSVFVGANGVGKTNLYRPLELLQATAVGTLAQALAAEGGMESALWDRLPAFIALNEPEASLHPDLLEPLARLIVHASERTQIWLVTHSERLAAAIASHGAITPLSVVKAIARPGSTA